MNPIPLAKLIANPQQIFPHGDASILSQTAQALKLVASICPDAEGGRRGDNGAWIVTPAGLLNAKPPKNLITLKFRPSENDFIFELFGHSKGPFSEASIPAYSRSLTKIYAKIAAKHNLSAKVAAHPTASQTGTDDADSSVSETAEDIAAIEAGSETERTELIKCRLGQGKFREALLKFRHRCYVTGITSPELLRASHIKPWRDSTNRERLDPYNGLLLSPLYDHLFDRALISFEDDGTLLISPKLPREASHALGLKIKFQGSALDSKTRAYLAHHRANFCRK